VALCGRTLWYGDAAGFAAPGWKADPTAVEDVEAVLDLEVGEGSFMLPAGPSLVLATYTTERFATVPRSAYVRGLDEPPEQTSARYALYLWIQEGYPLISRGVRDRLDLLDVAVLCVPADVDRLTEQLGQIAADIDAEVVPAGSLSCVARQGSAWA